MKNKMVAKLVGGSILSIILLAGCGANTNANTSQPANATNGTGQTSSTSKFKGGFAGGAQFASLSKVLKLPTSTIMSDLKSGESIEQIAQKQGIAQKTLVSELEVNYKASLAQEVSSGRITSSQEQQMISRYEKSLPTMIQHKGLMGVHGQGGHWNNATNSTSS